MTAGTKSGVGISLEKFIDSGTKLTKKIVDLSATETKYLPFR
jgi:hypothetical protein